MQACTLARRGSSSLLGSLLGWGRKIAKGLKVPLIIGILGMRKPISTVSMVDHESDVSFVRKFKTNDGESEAKERLETTA